MIVNYPNKNLTPFYPAKDNIEKVQGMVLVGILLTEGSI